MATLMALVLQKEYSKRITLYTYGSPRVGNAHFVRHVRGLDVVHYRYVNRSDIVPHLPAQSMVDQAAVQMHEHGIFSVLKNESLKSLYLHHGNFCHIADYHGYGWVNIFGQDATEQNYELLLRKDVTRTSVPERIPITGDVIGHFISQYLDGLRISLENKGAVQNIEQDKANRAMQKAAQMMYMMPR